MVSPAIVWDNRKFKMWYVKTRGYGDQKNSIYYMESLNGFNWFHERKVNIKFNKIVPWHIDVQKLSNGEYWMLITAYLRKKTWTFNPPIGLYLARSRDGINWKVDENPILEKGPKNSWDSDAIYRSTFLIQKGKMKVWYSAAHNNIWHIGYTEIL